MLVHSSELDRAASYRLMISALVPRPVAWVGSVSAAGVENLAPFSYFMGVSSAPPMVAISVSKLRDGTRKHTSRNILETGTFSISMVEESHLDLAHQTSGTWPGSEFEACNVPRQDGTVVPAPRVATARVAMELRLAQHTEPGNVDLIVGEVLAWHVDDALWKDGLVDIDGYRPIARLGGDGYTLLGKPLSRPPVRV